MKNNIIKIFSTIIILAIFSILITFLFNNINLFTQKNLPKDLTIISNSKINYINFTKNNDGMYSCSSEKCQIEVDLKKTYINNLKIDYKSNKNISLKLKASADNYYKSKEKIEIDDSLNSRITISVIPIRKAVSNIIIEFSDKDFDIKDISLDNRITFNIYTFLFIFSILLITFTLYLYYFKNIFNKKIEFLFLIISILIGLTIIVAEPATTSFSWDDQIHYQNTYRLTNIKKEIEYSQADYDMFAINPFSSINTLDERKAQNQYLNRADRIIMETTINRRVIKYNEVGYILPAIVLKIGDLLNLPFVITFKLSKIAVLLFYVIISFCAIKTTPICKRIFSIFLLLPSNIWLATQYSYDSPIVACIALFFALFLSLYLNKNKKIDLSQLSLLLFTILFASFIKAIYVPFILLLLLFNSDKFSSTKQQKYFIFGIILIFLLVLSTFVLPSIVDVSSFADPRGGNTSASGQISIVVHNLFGYLRVFIDNAGAQFMNKFFGLLTLGGNAYLGNFSENLYILNLFLLGFVTITDTFSFKGNNVLDVKNKVLIGTIILIIIILIWTALYISFTPVGSQSINGVQNRYFLPLLLPLLLLLNNNKIVNKYSEKTYDLIIFLIITIILFYGYYETVFSVFCM